MVATATALFEKPKRRNITLSLSAETVRKAKMLAVQRDTSVSALLTQQIEEMVIGNDSYEQAKVRALARLRSGFGFHGIEHLTREQLHDRKIAREAVENDLEP